MLPLLTNMPKDVLITQLKDGLVLLVLGMGTVFVFLIILIFATKLMSRIIMGMEKNHQSAPAAAAVQAAAQVQQKAAPAPQGDDAAVAAAIAAAYDRSRN